MAELAKEQESLTRPRQAGKQRLAGRSGIGCETGAGREPSKGAAVPLDEEVLRDLRHAVGNHFHKLFYWADRIESDAGSNGQRGQVEELTGALQRFQEYLELGLGYFEPQEGSLLDMGVEEFAQAAAKVIEDHLGSTEVSLEVVPTDRIGGVRVDPQRLSLALRMVADLLGGTARKKFAMRMIVEKGTGVCAMRVLADGGKAPVEMPVLEWAIARKAVAAQGGVLAQVSNGDEARVEGCVLRLPFGQW